MSRHPTPIRPGRSSYDDDDLVLALEIPALEDLLEGGELVTHLQPDPTAPVARVIRLDPTRRMRRPAG